MNIDIKWTMKRTSNLSKKIKHVSFNQAEHCHNCEATSRQQAIEGWFEVLAKLFLANFHLCTKGEFHILSVGLSVKTNAMPVASLETKLAALTRQQVGNWEKWGVRQRQKIPNKILWEEVILPGAQKIDSLTQGIWSSKLGFASSFKWSKWGEPGCTLASGWSSTSIATGDEAAAATAPWRWSLLVESCEKIILNSYNWNWQFFVACPMFLVLNIMAGIVYMRGCWKRKLQLQFLVEAPWRSENPWQPEFHAETPINP